MEGPSTHGSPQQSEVPALALRACSVTLTLRLPPKDPNNPMHLIFTDFGAQCQNYLCVRIPRVHCSSFLGLHTRIPDQKNI